MYMANNGMIRRTFGLLWEAVIPVHGISEIHVY